MSTVTKEKVGLLHEKINITLSKEDYLPEFEKTLKEYGKKANIPGFRKGMVPSGLIKKMYGSSLFTDEVLRSIDREIIKYLETEKLDIFGQPLPTDQLNLRQLDMNSPTDYHFSFEIGLKPEFQLPDLSKAKTIKYKVMVTDEMINNEIARLQNRYGNMKDEETVNNEDNVLNVEFIEADENGNEVAGGIKKENSLLVKYFSQAIRGTLLGKAKNDFIIIKLDSAFEDKEKDWVISDLGLKNDAAASEKSFKLLITKIGLLEKRELNQDFFKQLYPSGEVVNEADFRNKIQGEIQAYWDGQARNQIHDQVYHELVDHTEINFPEEFLKKWMKTQGDNKKQRTDEDVEKEFPVFLNQLKWTLITDKIVKEYHIEITADEIRAFAKQQLFGYMGMGSLDEEQPWVKDYVEKMMKDRKYIDDAYNRIQTQKIFQWAETHVKPVEKEITAEEFTKMVEAHQHHHH